MDVTGSGGDVRDLALSDVHIDVVAVHPPGEANNSRPTTTATNRTTTTTTRGDWIVSGFVKGRVDITDASASGGGGAHTLEAMFIFSTADGGSWEAGVAYSLRMDGVKLSVSGKASSPCEPDVPTELDGALELDLDAVALAADVSARHWCEPNATVRMEVNASIPRLVVLDGSLEITDVVVTWRALSGGAIPAVGRRGDAEDDEGDVVDEIDDEKDAEAASLGNLPAGTPLARLRQEGTVRGTVSTDFGIDAPGVKLSLDASILLRVLYIPGGEANNKIQTAAAKAAAAAAAAKAARAAAHARSAAVISKEKTTRSKAAAAAAAAANSDSGDSSSTSSASTSSSSSAPLPPSSPPTRPPPAAETGVKVFDPVLDVNIHLEIAGTMPEVGRCGLKSVDPRLERHLVSERLAR